MRTVLFTLVVFLSFKQEYLKGGGYKLSTTQRIVLALRGHVKAFSVDVYGKGPMDFYVFKCPEHKLVISRASGYLGELNCPYCPMSDGSPMVPNEYEKIKVS